jgi:diamine N-acetyltransferase
MTTIRLAQQADAKNLAALAIQVWLHTYAFNGISTLLSDYVFAEFTEEKFQQVIAAPDQCILVAEVNAHLVGYARLHFNAKRSDVLHTSTELATLYVQEHFTRREIGTALLAACAQHAQQQCGNPEFWLKVNHQNTRAISFYKKGGYTQHGIFFFELGDERHQNFVLAKTTG